VCAQVDTRPCRPVRLLCCLSHYSFPLACAIAPPWPALPSRCMALLTTANRLLPDLCPYAAEMVAVTDTEIL
jgi:hypothetical protein